MKQYWKQSAILACGLLLGFLLGAGGITGEKAKPAEEIVAPPSAAWMMIEKEEGKAAEAWKMGPREDASLLKVMEGLAEEESIEMKTKNFAGLGVMIEELQGRKNGERGNYWQYWINDEYAKVGADAYVPRGGDIIEWKFLGQQNL